MSESRSWLSWALDETELKQKILLFAHNRPEKNSRATNQKRRVAAGWAAHRFGTESLMKIQMPCNERAVFRENHFSLP
jgi:hypothetical protein